MPCAVFFDSGAESHAYVLLEESADEVGERLNAARGLTRFLTKHGHPIWINAATVRFIEDRGPAGIGAGGRSLHS